MTVYFITGNKDKLREVKELLPGVQGVDLDVMEIQRLMQSGSLQQSLQKPKKTILVPSL